MTGEEVRKMKAEELRSELAKLRNRLFDLRTQAVTDKVANTREPRNVRHDIARLLTERTARHAAKASKGAAASPKAEAKAATKKAPKRKASPNRVLSAKTAAGKAAGGTGGVKKGAASKARVEKKAKKA